VLLVGSSLMNQYNPTNTVMSIKLMK